ncbi:hypothetical protein AMI01nite_42170 [Aneurinibacillus migulanus]|nr:hypothetical protein AMI01nite_42170 [Aneurinibacillus migulanus]
MISFFIFTKYIERMKEQCFYFSLVKNLYLMNSRTNDSCEKLIDYTILFQLTLDNHTHPRIDIYRFLSVT